MNRENLPLRRLGFCSLFLAVASLFWGIIALVVLRIDGLMIFGVGLIGATIGSLMYKELKEKK